MNSTQETILSRWNTLSVRGKSLLEQKAPLEIEEALPPSVILVQLSRLFTLKLLANSLIITQSISDTIFLKLFLEKLDPKLRVSALFPKDAEKPINTLASDVIIAPYSLFSLDAMRRQPFNPEEFNCIIVDQAVPINLIDDLFFLEAENRNYLVENFENHPSYFLTTCFSEISEPILASLSKEKLTKMGNNTIEGNVAASEKHQNDTAEKSKDITEKQIIETNKGTKISLTTHKKATEDNKQVESDTTSDTSTQQDKKISKRVDKETIDAGTFIAMVPRNLQRQYIRDYIREHNLQDVLVITHNRQSARLLEKYLYRARIRSRIVHEKIDDETANSLFERYHQGQFNTLILMHRVVQDFADKITQCDAVFFLDFPTVYAEYVERLQFVQQKFNPQHFISIASENDQVWVDALFEEYPDLNLPIEIIDIKPPKRQNRNDTHHNNQGSRDGAHDGKEPHNRRDNHPRNNSRNTQTSDPKNISKVADDSQHSTENRTPEAEKREEKNHSRDERSPRKGRINRQERTKREVKPRTNRRQNDNRENTAAATQPTPKGESQSDFFSNNHDEIVNKNRLPFESGSFEANIARENRRRNRSPFGVPGGLGQSTDGNFIQNLTQGLSPDINPASNPNASNNNRRNRNNRPRTRRKK